MDKKDHKIEGNDNVVPPFPIFSHSHLLNVLLQPDSRFFMLGLDGEQQVCRKGQLCK